MYKALDQTICYIASNEIDRYISAYCYDSSQIEKAVKLLNDSIRLERQGKHTASARAMHEASLLSGFQWADQE